MASITVRVKVWSPSPATTEAGTNVLVVTRFTSEVIVRVAVVLSTLVAVYRSPLTRPDLRRLGLVLFLGIPLQAARDGARWLL